MRRNVDHYVYYKQVGENFIYVVLYVNDMLLVGNNMEAIKEVKMQLSFGATNFILGMDINRVDRKL